jgi:2-iminobutanoate/2-iminopropanoate deaminase
MIRFVNSPRRGPANLPFSQAVRVGDVLYLSGVIGNVPGRMELVPGGIEAEARRAVENIGAMIAGSCSPT